MQRVREYFLASKRLQRVAREQVPPPGCHSALPPPPPPVDLLTPTSSPSRRSGCSGCSRPPSRARSPCRRSPASSPASPTSRTPRPSSTSSSQSASTRAATPSARSELNLHVIHVGMAAVDGVIKLRGQAWNEDMIVASAELRHRSPRARSRSWRPSCTCSSTSRRTSPSTTRRSARLPPSAPAAGSSATSTRASAQREADATVTRRSHCPAASAASRRCRRWGPGRLAIFPQSPRKCPRLTSRRPRASRDPASAVLARQDRQGRAARDGQPPRPRGAAGREPDVPTVDDELLVPLLAAIERAARDGHRRVW